MFTLAIFNDGFCHTLPAWSVVGYMPAFQFSTAYQFKMKPGEFLRGYHRQLDAIFKSYQESEPLLQNVELPIGPNWSMIVNVKCLILFVIQDMEEEGDQLEGRFATQQAGVPHARYVTFNLCTWMQLTTMQIMHMSLNMICKSLQCQWYFKTTVVYALPQ